MEYLTTHDICWVNQMVTGSVNPFHYFTLEATMAAQYRYGSSDDVPGQAATFLRKMLADPAFNVGSKRTAFIATLTFLNANGWATKVKDDRATELLVQVANGAIDPAAAITELAGPASVALGAIPLRQLITHECNLHTDGLRLLAEQD